MMKGKIFIFIFCLVNILSVFAQDTYKIISRSNLNVRKNPYANSQVVGSLKTGTTVKVSQFLGQWAEIQYNHKSAYISAKYIQKVSHKELGTYIVTYAGHVYVREYPTTHSYIIGELIKDDIIVVEGFEKDWARLKYKKKDAYVPLQYIRKIEIVDEVLDDKMPCFQKVVEVKKEPQDVTPKKKKSRNSISNVGIDFIPIAYGGYSNYSTSNVSPKATIGFGMDCAFQFIALDNIGFIPKNYFMEASLGYSMRGSAAHHMHYAMMKFCPLGYKYEFSDWALVGKTGVYVGFPFSNIETDQKEFTTKTDFGLMLGLGVEYENIGVGLSYERGFSKVCDSKLSIKNNCVFFNVSYRLFNLK